MRMAAINCCRRDPLTPGAVLFAILLAFAAALLAAGPGLADELAPSTYGASWHEYRWFESLGYPDVAKAPFVRIAVGRWDRDDDPAVRPAAHVVPEYGFLLSQQGDRFSVLTTRLQSHEFTKTPRLDASGKPTPAYLVVDFEAADLAKFAAGQAGGVRRAKERVGQKEVLDSLRGQLADTTELFVLAWACSRQGHEELSKSLYDLVLCIPEDDRRPRTVHPRELYERVAEEIAHAEMWRTLVQFGDPGVSRQQLFERFNWIVHKFPDSEHVERAKSFAALLA